MDARMLNTIVNFIWGIADDCLRDVYVRGKYRDVILPMTVIRRLDAVLEDTKPQVLGMKKKLDEAGITNQWGALCNTAGQAFCNASPFCLRDLTSRPTPQKLKADFEAYLAGFSPNVQEILEKFKFRNQIDTMIEADILGAVIQKFISKDINLSPKPCGNLPGLDNHAMGTIFEELVRRFNQTYAPVLVEPEILLPENATARRLPGTDGKEKMSKSLGNCIYLSDDADTVWSKVKSMYTDPTHINVSDPGHVEGNAVFTYLDAFSTDQDFADFWPEFQNLDELKAAYTHGGIGDMKCKKLLNNVINRMLDPIRQRRAEYEKDIPEIFNILKQGSESARETAAQTMDDVRRAMRIDYFDDAELIRQQSEKFKR